MICLAIAAPSRGAGRPFDGVYAGERVWVEGPKELCPEDKDVSAIIDGDSLNFSDSTMTTLSLKFAPDPDGSFSQTSNIIGITVVIIKGHIAGDIMDVDLANISTQCTHHWHLTKKH
jgi:hypothetical protein